MRLPIVSIVGRPNVGKSTMFNRFLKRRQAVVDPTPGVTRDRHYAVADWSGRSFALIDTGGLIEQSLEEMQQHITVQSQIAIEQSDVVLFMVDGRSGIHPSDFEIAERIRKAQKPVVLAVNKIDGPSGDPDVHEFSQLGLVEAIGVSAQVGRSIGDLLDLIIALLPKAQAEPVESLRLAIVGRPNVGKSSLVNRLLGEPRMIVSNVPGTTRDSIDTMLQFQGKQITLIDTAGLRKPARVNDQIEFYTALRTSRAISRADVVCVLLDASQSLSTQDFKIAEAAEEAGAGLIFVVNKWDIIEKETDTAGAYVNDLHRRAKTFAWAPLVFVSAVTGQRAPKVISMAISVFEERARRISTPELTRTILQDIHRKPPPSDKGKFIKIKFVTQGANPPPTFVFFCNRPDSVSESYQRFLANRLRERFGFEGVPLRIRFRNKGR